MTKARREGLFRLLLRVVLLGCLGGGVQAALETLRHDQLTKDTSSSSESGRLESLEHLWEREAVLAQTEAERVLFNWDAAFVSLPTLRPTVTPGNPTRAPSTPPVGGTNPPTQLPPGETLSPTPADCLTGTTRSDVLLQLLSTLTSATLLTNPQTPQGAAFQFMVNDPLQPDVCGSFPTLLQRYSLATLYFSTGGPDWIVDVGWLTATSECTWQGINCVAGVFATNLTLPENNLVGTLPEEMSALTGLTQILLASNTIGGSLPLAWSDLVELCVIDMENNQLSGEPLPAQLLVLTNLKQLLLSNNPYQTSTLPQEISVLSQLSHFWLANGNLIGAMPSTIGVLTDLRSLILYDNEIDGTLPTQIGSLTSLENVQLQDNLMSKVIPSELFNLAQLEILRLDFNFFTGNIPVNVGNLAQVRDLRFNDNFMTGTIPESISSLAVVERISFGSNFLFGTIPTLSSTVIDTADFARAALSGTVPSFFFSIPTIRLLYLNNNALTGTVPAQFVQAPLLRDLFLNNNNLVGPVPAAAVGQLLNLNEFTLQANQLTGSMPQSICDLRQTGILFNLFSDCGGANPEIQCDFPACCNRCF